MFYALQADPSYWGSKVNLFVAAAPVTRLDHTTNPLIKLMATIQDQLRDTLFFFHVYSILGDAVSSAGIHLVCGTLPQVCQFIEGFAITHDPKLDDPDRFQVYMGHFPSSASLQSLLHYAQSTRDH